MTSHNIACFRCGESKSPDEFHNRRNGAKHSWCKVCLRAYISERGKAKRKAAAEARRAALREEYGASQRTASEAAQEGSGE